MSPAPRVGAAVSVWTTVERDARRRASAGRRRARSRGSRRRSGSPSSAARPSPRNGVDPFVTWRPRSLGRRLRAAAPARAKASASRAARRICGRVPRFGVPVTEPLRTPECGQRDMAILCAEMRRIAFIFAVITAIAVPAPRSPPGAPATARSSSRTARRARTADDRSSAHDHRLGDRACRHTASSSIDAGVERRRDGAAVTGADWRGDSTKSDTAQIWKGRQLPLPRRRRHVHRPRLRHRDRPRRGRHRHGAARRPPRHTARRRHATR